MVELIVNNTALELFGDEKIRLTFAVNELGKLKNRQGTFSREFKVPATPDNVATLDYANNLNVVTSTPYKQIAAEIKQDGLAIEKGFIQIKVWDILKKQITLNFFGNNVNWFDKLKDKKIADAGISDLDHIYNITNVENSRDNEWEDGYIYPWVNEGRFTTRAANVFNIEEIHPGVFVRYILRAMFADIGYKIDGTFFKLPVANKLIIPFSKKLFTRNIGSNEDQGFSYWKSSEDRQTVFSGNNDQVTFPTFRESEKGLDNGFQWYNPDTSRYTVTEDTTVTSSIYLVLLKSAGSGTLRLIKNGVTTVDSKLVSITSNKLFAYHALVTSGVDLTAGDYLEVFLECSSGTLFPYDGTRWQLWVKEQINEGEKIPMRDIQPDINQIDLLKTLMNQYGIVFSEDRETQTVHFNLFTDLKSNLKNALDWTDKVDLGEKQEIDFIEIVGNYKKVNRLGYTNSTEDDELETYRQENAREFGEGTIEIDNDFLDGEEDLYRSPFSATVLSDAYQGLSGDRYLPFIQRYSSNSVTIGSEDVDPSPRIMILVGNVPISQFSPNSDDNVDVTHSGGTNNYENWAWGYFDKFPLNIGNFTDASDIDPLIDSLAFRNNFGEWNTVSLIEKYWDDYVNILQQPRFVLANIQLNQLDLNNLDFLVPIYLEQYKSYFYINKIKEYDADNPITPVELIKLV